MWHSGCALRNGWKKGSFLSAGKSARFICALSTGGRQTSAFPHPARLPLGFGGIFNLLKWLSRGTVPQLGTWAKARPGATAPAAETGQPAAACPPASGFGTDFPRHAATRDGSFQHLPAAGAPLPAFMAESPIPLPRSQLRLLLRFPRHTEKLWGLRGGSWLPSQLEQAAP